jgi:hypothetical protein
MAELLRYDHCKATPSAATVGTSDGVVLSANKNRRHSKFTNLSPTAWVFLAEGSAAISNGGIALAPNGGTHEMNSLNLFRGDVHAISTASSNLAISEGT